MRTSFASLKVAHKLTVVVCTFVVPGAFMLWSLVGEQRIAIQFAAKEVAGVLYLNQLIGLQATAARASMEDRAIGSDLADRAAELEASHGADLETAAQAKDLVTALRDPGGLERRVWSSESSSRASATVPTSFSITCWQHTTWPTSC